MRSGLLALCLLLSVSAYAADYPKAFRCGRDYCLAFHFPKKIESINTFYLQHPNRWVIDLHTRQPLKVPNLRAPSHWQRMRSHHKGHQSRWVFYLYPQSQVAFAQSAHHLRLRFKRLTANVPVKKKRVHASRHPQRQSKQPVTQSATARAMKQSPPTLTHYRPIEIMIDPGHGGHDPGAIGLHRIYEKQLVLAISQKLSHALNHYPGIHARLTRYSDRYLSLRQRLRIARHYHSDGFVAIHADKFMRQSAHGASVYALSQKGASNEAARWLARSENRSELVGGASLPQASHSVQSMMLNMQQSITQHRSQQLADSVLSALKQGHIDLHRRKVDHAAFVVLKSPDIPSILIETGFVSNPKEARLLHQSTYQSHLAKVIAKGLYRYFVTHPPEGTDLYLKRHGTAYRVKKGDTLSHIARQFHLSVSQLAAANKKQHWLHPGDLLFIPPH